MGRLGEFDLPDRLAPTIPHIVTQLAFALMCFAVAELVRLTVNVFAPGAAVFALIFPAIMVATLFARWQSGIVTAAIAVTYTYFVSFLPVAAARSNVSPLYSVLAIIVAALITILMAEIFRRSVRRAAGERDRQIAERDLMLEEFDHRVKNNFTLVASLLDMQRRRAGDPATGEALGVALTRVESIARAHRHLYRGRSSGADVDMAAYLGELCTALAEALFLRGAITLACDADHAQLPRDRAVSIGLVLNELVTNAAKHAFQDRESGAISVGFRASGNGWRLTVADNGIGMPAERPKPSRNGGLGSRLLEAFAAQAGGKLSTASGVDGTVVTVELAA